MDLTVDFRGQKLAEELYQVVVVAFSVVAFVTGYSQRRVVTGAFTCCSSHPRRSSFRLMMLLFGAGVAVALLLCVPPWPFLRRHPLPWLQRSEAPAVEATETGAEAERPKSRKGGLKRR